MDSANQIYADGIGEINISGGMVRIDLYTLERGKTKDDKPTVIPTQRIIMPPDGFLRSFAAMENLVKQLVDAGVVKPRDGAGGENSPVSTENKGTSEPPKSPNF